MRTAFLVDDFTTPAPIVVGPATTIAEAFAIMEEAHVRHLPVMDDGEISGIVSDRDLRLYLGRTWGQKLTIGEVMHSAPMGVPAGTPLGEAAYVMAKYKVGSLLVYDMQGKLVGIFTDTDALNALVELTSARTENEDVTR